MAAEILAPAGSFEALTAAVRCGANAVYLGGKYFNARRNAANFSQQELEEAVAYCHARNVKVYLALNTLVADSETQAALDAIEGACKANVDALIIQDTGLAALVRRVSLSMPMHASTQMSVQSVEGIRELKKLGFCRVVLPRELSEKEIKAISDNTDMELEYFVHGALCMCVSGQCLMSSVLGGRSGNRGLCAQPCRLPFGVNQKGGSNLSLKDLSLVDELERLEKSGICSFKIEGRMKRPEYVAAAVTACKNSIEGRAEAKLNDALQAVFSRSGFTKGYFEGRLGREMFGTRRKEDVERAALVLSDLQKLYDKENPLIKVDFELILKKDKPIQLTAQALGKRVSVSGNAPQTALNRAVTEAELRERISKCGGTQFVASAVTVDCDDGLFVSAGELNALRRDALSALESKIAETEPKDFIPTAVKFTAHISDCKETHLRFFKEEQIPDSICGISRIILPLEVSGETVERLERAGVKTFAEVPCNVFSNAPQYIKNLNRLKSHGLSGAWVCNLDGVGIAKEAEIPFATGFGMNIFNTLSLETAENFGATDCLLSCELPLSQAAALGGRVKRGVLAYGRIPLMMTRNCPVKNVVSCAECNSGSRLVDRMNVEFPVVCKNGCSFILNSRPLWLADKTAQIRNVDYTLLYFTDESADECKKVIEAFENGGNCETEFTRGLYFKGVL